MIEVPRINFSHLLALPQVMKECMKDCNRLLNSNSMKKDWSFPHLCEVHHPSHDGIEFCQELYEKNVPLE